MKKEHSDIRRDVDGLMKKEHTEVISRAFRLMNRISQVVRDGREVAIFDVSNTWGLDGGKRERGRIKGTRIAVERKRGDAVWEVIT